MGDVRITQAAQHRRFERGTRYYELSLFQDLLGDWVVLRRYGRRGTRQSQQCSQVFLDYPLALAEYQRLCTYRVKQRGYGLVD